MIQPPPLHSKGPPLLLLLCPVLSAPAHATRLPGSGDHHHSTGRSSRAQLTRNGCCLLHDSSKNLFFFFCSSATSQLSWAPRGASGNPHNYHPTREQRTERDGVIKWGSSVVTDVRSCPPGAFLAHMIHLCPWGREASWETNEPQSGGR